MSIPPSAALLPVAVDIVVLTVRDQRLCVLLVDRGLPPFQGRPALPGGFVLADESTEQAASRELVEETGLRPPGHLEQLRSYGPVGRDPRGPTLSVAYLLLSPSFEVPRPGRDALRAYWLDLEDARQTDLAFDHAQILADGVERARAKIEYSPLATAFCPEEFTIAELRKVYEAVWGVELDPRNFHRKATRTPRFLADTGRVTSESAGRPASIYRLHPDARMAEAVLQPPLLRPASL